MKVWKELSKHSCVTPFPGETPFYTLIAKDTCTRCPCQPGTGDRGWNARSTLLRPEGPPTQTEELGVRGGSWGALTLLVEVSHLLWTVSPETLSPTFLSCSVMAFCLVFSALFYHYNLFLMMKGQKILLVEPCSPDLHSSDSE